jgi:hypothetical protein
MTELKTKPNELSVDEYIENIPDAGRRADSKQLLEIIKSATSEKPVMWGPSIVGFGLRHYKYESGREGDWMIIGFSARKQALTIYGVVFYDQGYDRLKKLGTYTTGKGCLYIKRLSDINIDILKEAIVAAYTSAKSSTTL